LYRLPIHLQRQSYDLKIREYVHRMATEAAWLNGN
jgi:hypothetical protein